MDTTKTEKKGNNESANRQRNSGTRPRRRAFREKPEFEQRILDIRRVTRVAAGGRRFSFSVSMVIGDRNGRVGVGLGKGGDTALAIGKAVRDAKKNLIKISLTDTQSIPYAVNAKYSSARVSLLPNGGNGLVAGGALRDVLELGGVTHVSGKILSRTKNHLNNAHATLRALSKIKKTKK